MKMKSWMISVSLLVLCACQSPSGEGNSSAAPANEVRVTPPIEVIPPAPPVVNPPLPETPKKTIALVYDGVGACVEDCAAGAAAAAKAAGLTAKIVSPTALSETATPEQVAKFFEGVAVWVQPGGYARNAYESMTKKLRASLKEFVKNGGGYVGYCAGAFMSTPIIGTTGVAGLGVFPGRTGVFGAPTQDPAGFSIEKVRWAGSTRFVYFEGGPYIYGLDSSADVIATYENGAIAAARAPYGKGRVFISGPHPEAPLWWSEGTQAPDRDGSDVDLASGMIRWAAGLE